MRCCRPFFALLGLLAAASAGSAQVVVDTFNRAGGTDLGANWTERAGDLSIVDGMVQGAPNSFSFHLATWNVAPTPVISADVLWTPTGVQYAALVLGYADEFNNLFVKVQDNGSANAFDRVFFYYGNNGSSFGASPSSESLAVPFTSGRIALTLAGAVATLTIDTNFDGIVDQTYTRTDVPLANLGTAAGIGLYGAAKLDNFALTPVPEPATWSAIASGLALLAFGAFRRRR